MYPLLYYYPYAIPAAPTQICSLLILYSQLPLRVVRCIGKFKPFDHLHWPRRFCVCVGVRLILKEFNWAYISSSLAWPIRHCAFAWIGCVIRVGRLTTFIHINFHIVWPRIKYKLHIVRCGHHSAGHLALHADWVGTYIRPHHFHISNLCLVWRIWNIWLRSPSANTMDYFGIGWTLDVCVCACVCTKENYWPSLVENIQPTSRIDESTEFIAQFDVENSHEKLNRGNSASKRYNCICIFTHSMDELARYRRLF